MILVIGGTGFIGKAYVNNLHAKGHAGMVVSRAPDREYLATHTPTIEAITLEAFHADPAAALFGCTAVVYLASNSTPASNLDAPWREVEDNLSPLLRVLKAIERHCRETHFVFLSSGGTVYGQVEAECITETTPLHPISVYGMGKKMMEGAVTYMADQFDLRTTILRPSNPIGPWQRSLSQGVVGILMRAALSGQPFPMLGDGSAERDYFDVEDLSSAIDAVIAQPERSVGAVFNVGSGRGKSVRQVVDMVERVTGRQIEITRTPPRSSDVDRVVLDTTKIETQLGWRPTHDLEETLRSIWKTVESQ